jgi:hypothetical protein
MITCPWLSRLEEWSWKFDSLPWRTAVQEVLVAQVVIIREITVAVVGLLSDPLSRSSREITVRNKQQSSNNPILNLLQCHALLHPLHPFVQYLGRA